MIEPLAFFQQQLEARKAAHLFRERTPLENTRGVRIRIDGKDFLSFCTNDYLGLASHPRVIKALQEGAERWGVGSGASALVSGYTSAHAELEKAFANFLQRDRAVFFSNGFMANIGVINALLQTKQAVLFQDKMNHASLLDAGKLSPALVKRYSHLNMHHLERQLQHYPAPLRIIATESIFSMTGDCAPLSHLVKLAKRHSALLMVDDAHGIGYLGANGKGCTEVFELNQTDVPLLVCPLGKAFGCYGAIVAGPHALLEMLVQYARSYIYTTALPPALAEAALSSLQLVQAEPKRREYLQSVIHYFKREAKARHLNILPSSSAIQPVFIGDEEKAVQIADRLFRDNILVKALRYPTVPKQKAVIRITLSAQHTDQDIERLVTLLESLHVTT